MKRHKRLHTGAEQIVRRHRRLRWVNDAPLWTFLALTIMAVIGGGNFGAVVSIFVAVIMVVVGLFVLVFSKLGDHSLVGSGVVQFFESFGEVVVASVPGMVLWLIGWCALISSKRFREWWAMKREHLEDMGDHKVRPVYESWKGICEEYDWVKAPPAEGKRDRRDWPTLFDADHNPGGDDYPEHLRIVWGPLGSHGAKRWETMSQNLSDAMGGVGKPGHKKLEEGQRGVRIETIVWLKEMEGRNIRSLAELRGRLQSATEWLKDQGHIGITDKTILALIGTRKLGGYAVGVLTGAIPHLALGGGTQSGKTSTLSELILGFMAQGCQIVISDGSNAGEFKHLRKKGIVVAPFMNHQTAEKGEDDKADMASRLDDHIAVATEVRRMMNVRAGLLNEHGEGNWKNLPKNADGTSKITPLVYVIDEAASLVLPAQEKSNPVTAGKAEQLFSLWFDIIINSAKNGIHVVMVSQRWDVKIFPALGGYMRSQMGPCVIGRMDKKGMEMLFDTSEAFAGGPGDIKFMNLNTLRESMEIGEGRAFYVEDNAEDGTNYVHQIADEIEYTHPPLLDVDEVLAAREPDKPKAEEEEVVHPYTGEVTEVAAAAAPAKKQRGLTPEQVADAKRRIDAGETPKDVADSLGRHRTTIIRAVSKYEASL